MSQNTEPKSQRSMVHMCISIPGLLRRSDRILSKAFKEVDGKRRSGEYVRNWLMIQLRKGVEVLPLGPKCEGWSDVTGCPGHPIINVEKKP